MRKFALHRQAVSVRLQRDEHKHEEENNVHYFVQPAVVEASVIQFRTQGGTLGLAGPPEGVTPPADDGVPLASLVPLGISVGTSVEVSDSVCARAKEARARRERSLTCMMEYSKYRQLV